MRSEIVLSYDKQIELQIFDKLVGDKEKIKEKTNAHKHPTFACLFFLLLSFIFFESNRVR